MAIVEEKRFAAFLASNMDERMMPLRARVHDLTDSVWMAEYSNPSMVGRTDAGVLHVCFENIRRSDQFICVLTGRYGATHADIRGDDNELWRVISGVSVLEMELVHAAMSYKPVTVYTLAPFEPDERLASLLDALKKLSDRIRFVPNHLSDSQLFTELAQEVDGSARSRLRRLMRRSYAILEDLLQFLARNRSRRAARQEVTFMGGTEYKLKDTCPPNETETLARLDTIASISNVAERLSMLWAVIRRLYAAPLGDRQHSNMVNTWIRTLSMWSSAAGWTGLNGHLFAGRLATVNAIARAREQAKTWGLPLPSTKDIHSSRAAGASEYYSLAKAARDAATRHEHTSEALELIDQSLNADEAEASDVLGIRASLRLLAGSFADAIEDYRTALRLREAASDIAKISETQVDLGHALVTTGQVSEGINLVEQGVQGLSACGEVNFAIRAIKKLATACLRRLWLRKAQQHLREAYALAEAHGVSDQQSFIRDVRRHFGI